jgi:hypothetical protein
MTSHQRDLDAGLVSEFAASLISSKRARTESFHMADETLTFTVKPSNGYSRPVLIVWSLHDTTPKKMYH